MGKKGEKKEDKPGFVKAYEKNQKQQEKELEKQLSIRERLMRRVKQANVTVSLTDDLGEFQIKCRFLREREQRVLVELAGKLAEVQTAKQYDAVMDELQKILAYPEGVCREPELDLKFWKEGNYALNDMLKILIEASKQTGEALEEVKSFRRK